jgi:CubicO group peptidase (beta-lactamase class C family)
MPTIGRPAAALGVALIAVTATAVPLRAQQPIDLRAGIDSIFAPFDGEDRPGCAAGVFRNGDIVFARGYGLADLEHRVPISPATIFDLGSTSKQISAAAILLLTQDGRFSIDDDVRRFVPELPDYGHVVTIRHLLTHTSGLRDYIGLLTLGGARFDDVTTSEDALRAIARQRELNFEPGSEFLYSNSGYFLLSVIVERTADMTLRDFARQRIFEPLGMHRTHYLGSYDDVVPGRASAYSPRPGTGGSTGVPPVWRLDVSRWLQTGDGAVFSSIEELLLWDRTFYDGSIGGRDLLDAMHARGILNNGDTLTYALGLMIQPYRGLPTVRHGGSWGGYRAELLRFPEQQTSIAVLCNAGPVANPSSLAVRVANVVLANAFTEPPTPPSPPSPPAAPQPARPAGADAPPTALTAATLAGFAGRYYSEELDVHFTLAVEDGALRLHRRNAPGGTLMPQGDDVFTAGSVRFRFLREGAEVSGFLLDLGRVRNIRFARVP